VGMSKATRSTLRKHLTKHFGGSGKDFRARELSIVPRFQGEAPFFQGVNVKNKSREMAAERAALWKMCAEDGRALCEWRRKYQS
jgi:hypothetical protein